jgi:integrase
MPAQKRHSTKYPGVYYIEGRAIGSNKMEKIYYIMYRKDGKQVHEKAGRQFADDMTPSKAAVKRGRRIEGKELTNLAKRVIEEAEKKAEAGKWTIDKLWTEYKSRRPGTRSLKVDDNRYQNHLKDRFGGKEPKELIQYDIDRLRIHLLKKRKPQTVKHILALLKRINGFGVKKGLCAGMPFSIELPKLHNTVTEDLTPEQLQNLLKAIDKSEDIQAANIMRMALFTGMRASELFKLEWRDIDFERGFIHIRDPKGGPDQKIPLNDSTRDLLNNHPRDGKNNQYVFPGRKGKRRTTVQKASNTIKKEAGLPKEFRPMHGLRHVYASMLASSGQVDMYTLQKLLTHKSPIMTQRYAHLRDDTLKRASNLAGDIITQAARDSSTLVDLTQKRKGK